MQERHPLAMAQGDRTGLSWVEAYRPKEMGSIAGQNKAVEELIAWAREWDGGRIPERKAAILDGEPGTGKTTAALALADLMGWQVIELNASDSRNQEAIRQMATRGSRSRSITDEYGPDGDLHGSRKLILLDEADNLYESAASDGENDLSDRGGKRAIVELIKVTMHPVVLIVNDLYSLTKGSGAPLNGMCVKVKFRRLMAASISKRLREICDSEGIGYDSIVLDGIAERSGGDMRAAIGDLQMLCTGRDRISNKDLAYLGERDTKENIFKGLERIFSARNFTESKRAHMALEEDPDMLLLWICENVPAYYRDPAEVDRAMELVSRADLYLGRTRRRQNFRLWRYASDMMTSVWTAGSSRGPRGAFTFPAYLRSMSRSKESRANLKQTCQRLGALTHCSVRAMKEDGIFRIGSLCSNDDELAANLYLAAGLERENLELLLGDGANKKKVSRIIEMAQERKDQAARPRSAPGALGSFDEGAEGREEEVDGNETSENEDGTSGRPDMDEGAAEEEKAPKNPQSSLFDF